MIDLTPLEVRKKKGDFRKALRGYEPALVDDFLDIVADRLDDLVRENAALKERMSRAESQVAEHREREKALTDALVTAQEMREGVRVQAAAEAEQTTRSARDEADRVLRNAKEESERLLRSASQKADEALRAANNDAEQTLKAAEEESTQMRSQALHAMRREEEALSRLRSRQQQLIQSYRTFLTRETEELQAIAETLDDGQTEPSAGGARADSPRADTTKKQGSSPQPQGGANAPVFPEPTAARKPDIGLSLEPTAVPFEGVMTVMGALEVEVLPDVPDEPFAPEPVDDWEEYSGPTVKRSAAARAADAGAAAASGDDELVDMNEVDLQMAGEIARLADDPLSADELALHDGISHDGIEYAEIAYDGIADPSAAAELAGKGADPYGAASYGQEDEGLLSFGGTPGAPGGDDVDEEIGAPDHDAEALLENALKAGYRLGLDDEDEDGELLLDEAADETDDGGPPRGWLDTIIDDEER